jgi:NitT/TauT family transport system permease protein
MTRYRSYLLTLLSACIVFGSWEIAGRVPVSFAFPTFTETIAAFWVLLVDGTMFVAYVETLKPLVVGVLISAFVGIALGLAIGLSSVSDWVVMQTAPLAALIPLLVMIYGIGLTSKVAVVLIMAMPVIVLNTSGAVRNTPVSIIEMAQAFLGTKRDVIFKVILPAASPIIFYRCHTGRAENHPHGCRRHYHLQPFHCRLSQHVCRDHVDHPSGCYFPERSGTN